MADDYPDAEFGFLLHDVGKVGVPESILNKPGPLTAAEWRVMRTHPTIGYQILAGIPVMDERGRDRAVPPRDVDGRRLPRRLAARGDPAAGPGVPGRRRLRRHDHRPALPGVDGVERAAEELARSPARSSTPRSCGVFVALVDDLPPVRG